NVRVAVIDDAPGLVIRQSENATRVVEASGTSAGQSDSYTVALAQPPAAGEIVTVTITAPAGLMADRTQLRFTADAGLVDHTAGIWLWDDAQTITLTAPHDGMVTDTLTRQVTHSFASSQPGSAWAALADTLLDVTRVDGDVAGVVITQTNGGTAVSAQGMTDSYLMALTTQPTHNVKVRLSHSGTLAVR